MLKKIFPIAALAVLLTGCNATFTNLTPKQQVRNEDGLYPVEVAMDTRQGIQYYAFNLLEEIDMPGEWYLDRSTGILYLYPPSNLRQASVEIGMLAAPMITLDKVAYVRIEGLVLDLEQRGRSRGPPAVRGTVFSCQGYLQWIDWSRR